MLNKLNIDAVLSKPLRWVSMTYDCKRKGCDDFRDLNLEYKDGMWKRIASLDLNSDNFVQIWKNFKRECLTQNKLKFGYVCSYEINHI